MENSGNKEQSGNRTLENAIVAVGFIVALIASVGGWYIRTPHLYAETPDGNWIIDQEVEAGTPVTLSYTHSVQKTMVYEYLEVNEYETGLVLKSTKYQSQGVGLPFLASEGNFRREGEWFITEDMNRPYPELRVRNGVTNHEHITVGEKDYSLDDLVPLETELRIYVAPMWQNFWQYFKF